MVADATRLARESLPRTIAGPDADPSNSLVGVPDIPHRGALSKDAINRHDVPLLVGSCPLAVDVHDDRYGAQVSLGLLPLTLLPCSGIAIASAKEICQRRNGLPRARRPSPGPPDGTA